MTKQPDSKKHDMVHDAITNEQLPIEVVDADCRTLLVMPASAVHRQELTHKIVLVMLYDTKGRVYLQKRAKNKKAYPDRWDLSATGHVQAGESFMGAALRELHEELGINVPTMKELGRLSASKETGQAFTALFSTGLSSATPQPNHEEVSEGMFIDEADMAAMVTHFSEMLTPAALWAYKSGHMFPDKR
ncbi:NUDIX hydrolase [Oleidesulfovibrio sp.]|uniref:NUDIX hydrolase n=1 Tax=Oleidesulfovibrio sp. TaxID=2909707 RepID=UPI003A8C8170